MIVPMSTHDQKGGFLACLKAAGTVSTSVACGPFDVGGTGGGISTVSELVDASAAC